MSWESNIAIRYLRSKRKDSFLSVITSFSFLGICLGVATLIIVMSVMGGFREELLNRIIGMKGHIIVYSCNDVPEDELLTDRLRKCNNVTQVCPILEKQTIITGSGKTRGVVVLAMSPQTFMQRDMLVNAVLPKFNTDLFVGNVIFLGKRMAELMNVQIGDNVTLMDPQGISTPFGTVPKQQEFKVIGLFEVGMIDYDKNMAIMPLCAGQDFFQMEKSLTQYEIFTSDIQKNNSIVSEIKKLLPKNMMVLGWRHGDSNFFQAIQVERNVMFLILTLIIVIASFNIISGLVMLVKDKTRDIAIIKTIGASSGSIMRIFMMTGSAIGLFGTAVGLLLGIVITLNINHIVQFIQQLFSTNLFSPEIYFLSTLPSKLNFVEVISISSISIILSLLATLYPALRAAKLDPAEAIRGS
ncbi:MAG: lipoprotein-releasing ABC transporter permease subunit [Holosporales bacterium]|jgi:lipoprotein-releasing system permease protein|nr:lipoprotein-releasing ABC transporter permease subunit [Holosporales bacterium]